MNSSHDSGESQGSVIPSHSMLLMSICSFEFCDLIVLWTSLSEFLKPHLAHLETPFLIAFGFPKSSATACAVRIWLTQLASAIKGNGEIQFGQKRETGWEVCANSYQTNSFLTSEVMLASRSHHWCCNSIDPCKNSLFLFLLARLPTLLLASAFRANMPSLAWHVMTR